MTDKEDIRYQNYQLCLTLDEHDNIIKIDTIENAKQSYSLSGGPIEYTYTYYESSYIINNFTPNSEQNIEDTFTIKDFEYKDNDETFVVENYALISGNYDKLFANHSDYGSEYKITELTQFNKNITVDGELTVNETLNQEEANAELKNMKNLYDVSNYPVEEIDPSLIYGTN